MASSGAILSLDAIGGQDKFILSKDIDDSHFAYNGVRHSNFSLYQSVHSAYRPAVGAGENWPFNNIITINLDPKVMGDLLANMYIKVSLPELEDAGSYKTYVKDVGFHIINKVTFRIDELEVETVYGDWMVVQNELFNSLSNKRATKNMVNDSKNLIIHVPSFFSRSSKGDSEANKFFDRDTFKNYFPLCAVHKQKIQILIEFNPITFFTDTNGACNLDKVDCITEEIILTPEERLFLNRTAFKRSYNVTRRQPILDVESGSTVSKSTIVSDSHVKLIVWFFRKAEYEDKTLKDTIMHRFNFSNADVKQDENPIMSTMSVFLDGVDHKGISPLDPKRNALYNRHFYKYIQSGLYPPDKDIFSYTFSLKSHDPTPSGGLNFAKLGSQRAFLNATLHANATGTYRFHSYCVSGITLTFDDGHVNR